MAKRTVICARDEVVGVSAALEMMGVETGAAGYQQPSGAFEIEIDHPRLPEGAGPMIVESVTIWSGDRWIVTSCLKPANASGHIGLLAG